MTVGVPLSERLREAVDRCFRSDDRQPAVDALASVQSEEMREAIVILAYGDRTRLEQLVESEKTDSRDVWGQLDEREADLKTTELIRRCRELGLPVPWPWCETLPEKIEADVRRFVGEELIIPVERIQPSMRLQEDLGATGEAGIKFMESFAKQFRVDLRDFRPEAHFAKEEDFGIVSSLRRLLGRPKKLLPITVQDLVEAVQQQKFATPVEGAG
jgi:hypothetical protein